MAKIIGLKFGDIVENGWASPDNPNRKGVFIRSRKRTIELTNMKGRFWELYNDKDSKTTKVGTIFNDDYELI